MSDVTESRSPKKFVGTYSAADVRYCSHENEMTVMMDAEILMVKTRMMMLRMNGKSS